MNVKIALYISHREIHAVAAIERQGPWFKVSSEGTSTEIDIIIRSPIPILTDPAVA